MPRGDMGEFVSFDFKIKLSNSQVKHHFLFAPKIYIGDILPRETVTTYKTVFNKHDRRQFHDEPLIAYVHDFKCNP